MAVTFNKEEQAKLDAAGKAWNEANQMYQQTGDAKYKDAMEKAHADAEAVRATKGYSGGDDGSQHIALPTGNKSGNSQYSGYVAADPTGVDNYHAKNTANHGMGMSASDLALLGSYGDKWNAATTQEEKDYWHGKAEELRESYGYLGGDDGSEYLPIPQQKQPGFSFSSAPTYNDQYSARIDELLNQILNRDSFSYNAQEDELFKQYQDQYTREGERAMKDTLGQMAARTGGLASSYATSAAMQQNNYYMQQLSDKIPELYQLAYQMYLDDIDLQVQDLGLLQNASETSYDRYRDTMADWRDDRNFAYNKYRDDVADGQWQTGFDRDVFESDRDFDYMVGRDEIEDARYDEQWAYEMAQDQLKASSSGGSGGSRSSGGSGGKSKPTLTAAQTLSALEKGVINETTKAAYEYYFGEPYEDGTGEEPEVGGGEVDLSDVQPGVLADIRSRLMELGPSSSDEATRARELLKILNSMASSGLIDADQADRIAAFYGY